MNLTDPLQVVLDRTGYADPAKSALFFWDEVKLWPSGRLDTLVASGLLQPAQPMSTIACDGCEENCNMPVVVYPAQDDKPGRAFINCAERDDIGRIRVSFERLRQWQCTAEVVCVFVAAALGLRRSDKRVSNAEFLEIGMARGNKRNQMLCLQTGGQLMLVAGGNKIPLVEFITFDKDVYSLDGSMIRILVDAATTADNRHTPSNAKRESRKLDTQAMYQDWQRAYRHLRKKHKDKSEVWCSQQIAKMPIAKGRKAGTIKKNMFS